LIRRLEAQRFRNLEPLVLELDPGSTLLVGPTGAGKTSVLEALYVAATTRSFRTAKLEECVRSLCGDRSDRCGRGEPEEGEEPSFWVALEIDGARRSRLEVSWAESSGLQRSVDGERASIAEHLGRQPVLAFSWEDGDTWVAEPDLRRRFVDRGLVAERSIALEPLSRYRRVLAHKRSLLAEGRCKLADLEPWNALFAQSAAAVRVLRGEYVHRLDRALQEVIEISGLDLLGVEVSYRPSPDVEAGDAEGLLQAISRGARREVEAGRPLFGPHRDVIELTFRRQPVARVASSGERRALTLLAVAAQGRLLEEIGRCVALLIDDADVELDRPTLNGIWRAFLGAPQLLVSSNRPEVWNGLGTQRRIDLAGGRMR
jgi:DNA replication and repair protein RecF